MSKFKVVKLSINLLLVAITILVLALVINAEDTENWTMKLGSKEIPGAHTYDTVEKFIELVEKKSDGKIKIEHFPNEILGSTRVQLENLSTGVIEFYAGGSYTHYAHLVPEFRVHSLSFLFTDYDRYRKFLLSPIQKEMEEKLINQANIRILNESKNWQRDAHRVLVTRYPVQTLEDIKGLKLRLSDAPATIKVWEQLGASIVIIPFSEVYLGLQQGMVDALTTGLSQFNERKFYEVVKEVTLSHELEQQFAIAMNEDTFQSLPKELQNALIEAAKEAGDLATEVVVEIGEELMEKGKTEYGVNFKEWTDIDSVLEKAKEAHIALEESGFIPKGLLQRINDYMGGE